MAAGLVLADVCFAHGTSRVLDRLSFSVPPGSFAALLGASGSGKTTLLRLVAGYLSPSSGTITLGGRDVTRLPPEKRGVGMVFQNYALFPHLSARGNVAFGPSVRGVPRRDVARRVEAALDLVDFPADARDRLPSALSGGQQQRVALARALVTEPDLLLLDEPLANLDRRLREQVRGELRDRRRRTGVTTLLVTHDHEEALALADVVAVVADGRILQAGTPRELYDAPVSAEVARLVGDVNEIPAPNGTTRLVRPERVRLDGSGEAVGIGTVADVQFQGASTLVVVRVANFTVRAVLTGGIVPNVGDRTLVGVAVAP